MPGSFTVSKKRSRLKEATVELVSARRHRDHAGAEVAADRGWRGRVGEDGVGAEGVIERPGDVGDHGARSSPRGPCAPICPSLSTRSRSGFASKRGTQQGGAGRQGIGHCDARLAEGPRDAGDDAVEDAVAGRRRVGLVDRALRGRDDGQGVHGTRIPSNRSSCSMPPVGLGVGRGQRDRARAAGCRCESRVTLGRSGDLRHRRAVGIRGRDELLHRPGDPDLVADRRGRRRRRRGREDEHALGRARVGVVEAGPGLDEEAVAT